MCFLDKVFIWIQPLTIFAKSFILIERFWIHFYMIYLFSLKYSNVLNPLSANTTKWSNTFKQFVGCCRIVWVCLTILWGWHIEKKFFFSSEILVNIYCLQLCCVIINLFHVTSLFLYPLKTSKKQIFSKVFSE